MTRQLPSKENYRTSLRLRLEQAGSSNAKGDGGATMSDDISGVEMGEGGDVGRDDGEEEVEYEQQRLARIRRSKP